MSEMTKDAKGNWQLHLHEKDRKGRDFLVIYPSDRRIITLDKGNGILLKCKSKGTAFIGERRAIDEKRNCFTGRMKDLWDENSGDVSLVLSRVADQASRQERNTLTC